MSDFTWYSRLLIWVGAGIFVVDLLAQGLESRTLGFPVLVAVIFLGAGLGGFILGLALDQHPLTFAGASGTVPPMPDQLIAEPAQGTAVGAGMPTADIPEEMLPATSTEEEPAAERPAVPDIAEVPLEPAPVPVAAHVDRPRTFTGARSEDVIAGSRLVRAVCPSCHEPLRLGQVAAVCGTCGGVHHATCWVSNHFHCARDGCAGHGNLVAPAFEDVPDPEQ